MSDSKCKHELDPKTCSVCLKRDDIDVPDPLEGVEHHTLEIQNGVIGTR